MPTTKCYVPMCSKRGLTFLQIINVRNAWIDAIKRDDIFLLWKIMMERENFVFTMTVNQNFCGVQISF